MNGQACGFKLRTNGGVTVKQAIMCLLFMAAVSAYQSMPEHASRVSFGVGFIEGRYEHTFVTLAVWS